MPLNDLSLEDLSALQKTVSVLVLMGRGLEESGLLAPRFDLTPGEAVTITTSFRMPAIESRKVKIEWRQYEPAPIDEEELPTSIKAVLSENDNDLPPAEPGATFRLDEPPSTEAAPPEPALVPVEPPAATDAGGTPSAAPGRPGEAASPPPEVADPGGVADSGGGQQVMAVATPPAATHERAFSGVTPWTPEEDARLIALVVSGVTRLGLTKGSAIKSAAHELGRPERGTIFRCHHKLKDRLNAAIGAAFADRDPPWDEPEPTPIPVGPALATTTDGTTASDGDAAAGGHSPAAVQDDDNPYGLNVDKLRRARALLQQADAIRQHEANDLTAHLMALPDKNGWTLQRDLELMELSIEGWQPQHIALQLGVQDNQIKPRFDALTGLHQDENGKKVRRFTREIVVEALTRLKKGAA